MNPDVLLEFFFFITLCSNENLRFTVKLSVQTKYYIISAFYLFLEIKMFWFFSFLYWPFSLKLTSMDISLIVIFLFAVFI